MDESVHYLSNGSTILADEARSHNVLYLDGDVIDGRTVVRCFADVPALLTFTDRRECGARARRAAATIAELAAVGADNTRRRQLEATGRAYQEFVADHLHDGLRRLSLTEPERSRDEVEMLAMGITAPFHERLFDPILFYDLPFETSPPVAAPEGASSLPLPGGFWPSLSWFGWNDRARGARTFGGSWLYADDWFMGRSVFVDGFNGLVPLAQFFLDSAVSSVAVLT